MYQNENTKDGENLKEVATSSGHRTIFINEMTNDDSDNEDWFIDDESLALEEKKFKDEKKSKEKQLEDGTKKSDVSELTKASQNEISKDGEKLKTVVTPDGSRIIFTNETTNDDSENEDWFLDDESLALAEKKFKDEKNSTEEQLEDGKKKSAVSELAKASQNENTKDGEKLKTVVTSNGYRIIFPNEMTDVNDSENEDWFLDDESLALAEKKFKNEKNLKEEQLEDGKKKLAISELAKASQNENTKDGEKLKTVVTSNGYRIIFPNETTDVDDSENEDWFLDDESLALAEKKFKDEKNSTEEQLEGGKKKSAVSELSKASQNENTKDGEKLKTVVTSSGYRIIFPNETTDVDDSENEDWFLDDESLALAEKKFKGEKKANKQQPEDEYDISEEIELDDNQKEILLQHKLNTYFMNFFPFGEIYDWLNYGGRGMFQYREFVYTLVVKETVIRNITFRNCDTMIRHCLAHLPVKIDIGARFHTDPQDASSTTILRHAERELIFDIDMSDYDNVRTCCSESNVCPKCWKYAAVACKILDASFREDFGWKHIVWIFSGRRGIHAWVCDKEVRVLSSEERQAIIAFYTVSAGNTARRPELRSTHLHRYIRRSYAIAVRTFVSTCVREQNILGTEQGVKTFLAVIPEGSYRENVKKLLRPQSTSLLRWAKFFAYWKSQRKLRSEEWKQRPHLLHEIVLFYMYPRLDADVTTDRRHLLKSPFSLHPKTLKVCIPVDPSKVDEFDVTNVPSLDDLVDSIVTHEASSNLDENQETLSNDCESSWEDQDTFGEIIEDHENLPKVLSKAAMQKQKYLDSVKFFRDFVDKMEESPDESDSN